MREGRPIEILLVEDNPGDARLAWEAIREAKVANNLRWVADGVEALAYLRREGKYADTQRPDLILLDLNLPRKDRREVLADIKYIEEHKEEVMADYQKMLEREARGNPPELQKKLDETHAKYQAIWAERRRLGLMPEDDGDEGDLGGQ